MKMNFKKLQYLQKVYLKKNYILLFIFLILFLLYQAYSAPDGSFGAAEEIKCSACGEKISGKYWMYADKPVCQNCYNTQRRVVIGVAYLPVTFTMWTEK